ncbi:DUF4910 domain-containing protein [Treponema parvum]|uniref:DUF4910 domain-containing protein n=1 Tax=Treponema parvum TaxID=138851 RepID=A0A975EYS3_9SPIR|nr:DUF4910 domain-containing protein [Treponema parvum]QTQ11288.1 DUF4910 domain-containing protein [Treponema parvum]QTQ16772.1 DUF4910 domain-containing protein [Treponema parvum]
MKEGEKAYDIAVRIFPICRSITGNGVRQTLQILKEYLPEIEIKEVSSGTKCFDWTIPKEWNISDAYIEKSDGSRILDFKDNNLHVIGYSTPVDKYVTLAELKSVVYTQADQPDVIPYITSYYKERYGFCMSQKQKDSLEEDNYHIVIKSSLNENGSLTYGECIISGGSKKEILISTYICHPSMANNECSGPAVSVILANSIKKMIEEKKLNKYTFRFLFIPETIGSIMYLSSHLEYLKQNVISGFNLTCVGDDRTYSFVHTRYADTITDRLLENVLSFHYPDYKAYSFLERGSDERQYNSPGVDLPICTFSRSLFRKYPEYHTSADNLGLISPAGLQGSYDVIMKCIIALEYNEKYRINCFCEPQLGKRGLYPTVSQKGTYDAVKALTDFIAYADGRNDLIDISNIIKCPCEEIIEYIIKLLNAKLLHKEEGF